MIFGKKGISLLVIITIVVLVLILFIGVLYFMSQPQKYTGWFVQDQEYKGPVEKITLAAINGIEWGSPLYIATAEQGYFAKNGLDINFQYYEAGKLALGSLINGEADLATVADAAFVPKTFDNPDLRILATIEVTTDMVRLVSRKDRDIIYPADLKGKRIGVTFNTISHFFLRDFLLAQNLFYADVVLVDLLPSQMLDAITKGNVDAVSTWEPHAYTIAKALGDNSNSWSEQIDQGSYFLVVGKEKWVRAHPELVKRFLVALQNGELYLRENDEQVKQLATTYFKIDEPYANFLWPKIQFNLALSQALIVVLEDQARWQIDNKFTNKTEIPNYLDYIYFDALEEVKPEAITIIR